MKRKLGATHQFLQFLQIIHTEDFRLILMITDLRFHRKIISKIHGYIPVFNHCKTKFGQ